MNARIYRHGCLLAAALLLMFSCTLADAAPKPLPEGDWVEHGLKPGQRENIRAAFQRGIDGKFIPGGALLLIHRGEVIFREAFGVADIEAQRPFGVDSPCRIASLTKPHTATTIVILAEQGKLSLDDPVDKFLPEFKGITIRNQGAAPQAPTIEQCLSHTAGFAGNNALKAGKFEVNLNGSLAEVVADAAQRGLVAAPGERYAYSRLGYMTAGRVAEVVTGKPFPDVMSEVLLAPIGAEDSTFSPSDELQHRMPIAYERTRAGFQPRQGRRLGTAINPGGSLVATLDGVGRLMLLHRNRGQVDDQQIVSAEMLAKMYVPRPGTPGAGYGLGFNILKKRADGSAQRVRHTGAAGTLAVIDFDFDLIIVVLTQVPQQQTLKWRGGLVRTIDQVFAGRN